MATSNETNTNETKKDLILNLINDYENIKRKIEFARDENFDLDQLEDQKNDILSDLADNISEIDDYNLILQNACTETVDDVMSKKQKMFWTMEKGIVTEVADKEALQD